MEIINELISYGEKKIRVVGTTEEPWFCGKDVCEILGYADTDKAIRMHVSEDDKEKLVNVLNPAKTAGFKFIRNEANIIYINESGLYSLMLSSKLETAKQFKQWVTKEVLPSIRKKGEYKLQKALEESVSALEIKDKELEESKLNLKKEAQEKANLERYTLRLKDMIVNIKSRTKDQIIYIATTKQYAVRNRFKVGGVKNVSLLKGRLASYNTGRPNGDKMYFSFIVDCVDFKHLEQRIDRIIGDHKDSTESEVYVLHYTALKEIIEYLAERFDEEINKHKSIFDNLVRDTIYKEPFIPEPLIINGAEYRSIKNGIEVSTQKVDWDTMDNEAKITFVSSVFEEYMKSEYVEDSIIQRKEFENYLAKEHRAKFNKRSMWAVARDISIQRGCKIKY